MKAGVWTKAAITNFRTLLKSRRAKAVNGDLQNFYEIPFVSVVSKSDVTGVELWR
jgi:hypothetical protein